MSERNGNEPLGYRATIHQAPTRPSIMILGIPREVLGILGAFCAGVGLTFDSYGAIFVFVAGAVIAFGLTRYDPYWPQRGGEVLRLRLRILWYRFALNHPQMAERLQAWFARRQEFPDAPPRPRTSQTPEA